MAYSKLANSILTSTIWMEDDHTRLVWLAMIAMANRHGEVLASIPGLANVARVPIEACRAAIHKFLSPDPDSRSKIDGGRRIKEIDGGWFLTNYEYYRFLASDEDRRNKAAVRQQRVRDRKKAARDASRPPRDESHQFGHAEAEAEAEAEELRGASATPPAAPQPPTDPTPQKKHHPAIVALHAVTGIYPPKEILDDLIDQLGIEIDQVRLKQCYLKWRARGYNKTNYDWATDWYVNNRIPEQGKNNGTNNRNQQPSKPTSTDRLAGYRDIIEQYPTEAELRNKP
jgi:hypothetical protein